MRATGTAKMTVLQCPKAKRLFSPYLDGASRAQRCSRCRITCRSARRATEEYQALRRTQQLLVNMATAEGSGRFGAEVAAGDFARSGAGEASIGLRD